MKNAYLFLALLGALVPYTFFFFFFRAEGAGLTEFIQSVFANGASGGLTADLLISSLVFWIWLFRSKARRPWIYILLNLAIGLSCAFPAYLYARERGKAQAPNH